MRRFKTYATLFLCVVWFSVSGQINYYNQFPSKKPMHILDDKLEDISFALSMRVLESDYNGPLIKLRRENDNTLRDFSWGDNDVVNVAEINSWRSGQKVYVHTWYDQSGMQRNAVQNNTNRQPEFFPNAAQPYFKGDGINDHLTIVTPRGIQDVTNSGDEGTVITIAMATDRRQHSFGVLTNADRWSSHINWSDDNLYFDPGVCCDENARKIRNRNNENKWEIYSFIKTPTNTIIRSGGIEGLNARYRNSTCTREDNFTIGWANGNQPQYHSDSSFTEFIMYSKDKNATVYQDIENNAIIFWGL